MEVQELARIARHLNRLGLNAHADKADLPTLLFFIDPVRTPDPCAIVARLPRGAAVVYRHFGAVDRLEIARRLKRICVQRRLFLLIGADPGLARAVKADGVHWPERAIPKRKAGFQIETGAAHSGRGLRMVAAAGLDAAVLSPVFPSRSASAGAPFGVFRAGALARTAQTPVVALGGVNARTAQRLIGSGFAGLAAVEAFAL